MCNVQFRTPLVAVVAFANWTFLVIFDILTQVKCGISAYHESALNAARFIPSSANSLLPSENGMPHFSCTGAHRLLVVSVVWAGISSIGVVAIAQGPNEKKAIDRGVDFLRKTLTQSDYDSRGESVLAAYAMIKGGVKPTDPVVSGVVSALRKRMADGKYRVGSDIIYSAGCELMLLEAAETRPGQYRKEMELIVKFIVDNQSSDGSWNYLNGDKGGDTSVTQYGLLGLWAAKRKGLDVSFESLERAARWLIDYQKKNGAFDYRPTSRTESLISLAMTVSGVASVLVVQRYLHPNETAGLRKKKRRIKKRGVVEKVDIDTEIAKNKGGKKKVKIDYEPKILFARYKSSVNRGVKWCAANSSDHRFRYYTLYGIERSAALGAPWGRNWYAEGSAYMLKMQAKNGSWTGDSKTLPCTSFAILFLTRSTFKLLGEPPDLIGDGLLRGGRGLPTDLSTIEESKNGEIKKRASVGPIDDLLKELQKPNTLDVPEIQKAIVQKIQLGDREQWKKPSRRAQLLKMVDHKSPEVRSVAVWALGRTGHIDVATILMNALEKDPDLDVAIEARNALCWLSRKPLGFNLPEKPEIPEGATKAQRTQAISKWRNDAVERWKKWYLQVRPYRERDDLKETKPVG